MCFFFFSNGEYSQLPPAGTALNLLNHTGSYCSQSVGNASGKTNEKSQNNKISRKAASAEGWGVGVVFRCPRGFVLWFMGRHCVRFIPKMKNTTTATTITTAAIDTDGNKKQFPPKRCVVGAPQHRMAQKSMKWGPASRRLCSKQLGGGVFHWKQLCFLPTTCWLLSTPRLCGKRQISGFTNCRKETLRIAPQMMAEAAELFRYLEDLDPGVQQRRKICQNANPYRLSFTAITDRR